MVMGMTCQWASVSVVQPRCSNNSNNSGHEPGKVVANDTTTTTEDDCRPAAPRWTAGVPTGHPVPTQAREECADSDNEELAREGRSAHQDEAAPEAQSLRRWRTALDYCGPTMEGQRTRVLTRSPATTQAHEECADSDIGESTRDGRRWRTRTKPPEALATYDGLGRLHCLENTRDNARE